MKIAVNTRLLIKNRLDGIGWFSYETLKRITMSHPEVEFTFIFDRPYSNEFIFSKNIKPVILYPQARHPFLFYWWFEHSIAGYINKNKFDLFLSPDGYLSLSAKVKSLAVIHDINFAHRPKDLPFLVRKYYNYYFPKFAYKATRIVTVSEYSRNDIASTYSVLPEKIDVVYNGANQGYKPINDEQKYSIRQKYASGEEFFIFVGTLHPRKNVHSLIKAFDIFKEQTKAGKKLIIVGDKMFLTGEIIDALKNAKYASDVIFTGRLELEELQKVMASALALVFVPFFEGFGIPIVEAMYCDVPVIASNVTSMPEIAGNAACYADPNSISSISNAMIKLANDKEYRENLIANAQIQRLNYSWDKTANLLWQSILKSIK